MPDFSARVSSGVTVSSWTDPDSGSKASRIRPYDDAPHLRHVITSPVEILCTPDGGSEGPLDSTLGGRLFQWCWVEYPGLEPLINTSSPYSSKANFQVLDVGHYTLQVFRESGGSVIIHFDKDS